ncbi:MAG TPA: hypothetical protein VHQ98_06115 [Gaiellaceae bacterium]|nr:hypothetical protein [Gaiellaceae bacterium]
MDAFSPPGRDSYSRWDDDLDAVGTDAPPGLRRGLDSRAVPWGRLMPESEQLVAAFQRRLYDALTA